ncbi:MAG: 30S ribosomal protein S3 [Candidatus Bathyarchaeia archaeon]
MSAIKHFIAEAIRSTEIDEFLRNDLDRAGYGGIEITRTPMGDRVTIYAMRPGIVIGRRGSNIRGLEERLRGKFKLMNPQIVVAEIEVPELNPHIMASRIASAIQRGVYFRRAGYWARNQIMSAGAQGVEITIKGKLRTQRHRYERYRAGYLPKSGDPALKHVKTAVTHVKLKPGVMGVKVKIVPPEARFPDQIEVKAEEEAEVEAIQPSPRV